MILPIRIEQVEFVRQKHQQSNQTLIRCWRLIRLTKAVLFMGRQLINSKAATEN